jgi:hypothetical protein
LHGLCLSENGPRRGRGWLEVPAGAAQLICNLTRFTFAGNVARYFGANAVFWRVLNGDEFFATAGGVSDFWKVHFVCLVVRFDGLTIYGLYLFVLAKSAILHCQNQLIF